MPVPDYQSLMLTLLEGLADGSDHGLRELRDHIARKLALSDADREDVAINSPHGRKESKAQSTLD